MPEIKADLSPTPVGSTVWRFVALGLAYTCGFAFAAVFFGGLGVLPILQFIPLGFLFEVQRRVVLGGRTAPGNRGNFDADFLVSYRIGVKAVGWGLVLLPVATFHAIVNQSKILDPGLSFFHGADRVLLLLWLVAVIHLVTAELRGGGRRLFEPLAGLRWLLRSKRDDWRSIVNRFRIAIVEVLFWGYRLFLRGLRGFIAVGMWLWPSATLVYFGFNNTACELLFAGLLLLTVPLAAMASVRFAVEDRIVAAWNARELIRRIVRAPWSVAAALLALDVLTLPLYWPTYEQPAWDTAWGLNILAFAMIFPTKLLSAWAYRRADRADSTRLARLFAIPAFLAILVTSAAYSAVVCLAPGWSWLGKSVFFDQHAFLLPNLH